MLIRLNQYWIIFLPIWSVDQILSSRRCQLFGVPLLSVGLPKLFCVANCLVWLKMKLCINKGCPTFRKVQFFLNITPYWCDVYCVDQPVHLVKALQTTYIFESREFDQLIRWEGKWFNIDSTGPTRNSESESENEMRIQCKHQKTW